MVRELSGETTLNWATGAILMWTVVGGWVGVMETAWLPWPVRVSPNSLEGEDPVALAVTWRDPAAEG